MIILKIFIIHYCLLYYFKSNFNINYFTTLINLYPFLDLHLRSLMFYNFILLDFFNFLILNILNLLHLIYNFLTLTFRFHYVIINQSFFSNCNRIAFTFFSFMYLYQKILI